MTYTSCSGSYGSCYGRDTGMQSAATYSAKDLAQADISAYDIGKGAYSNPVHGIAKVQTPTPGKYKALTSLI